MKAMRLEKFLCTTGRWSRREAKLLIRQCRVLVNNGVPVSERIDPEQDYITVDGQPVYYQPYVWIMLNKPAGYLSATEDTHGSTVLDLLSPELKRQKLFPVGRLDKDTEGLLLLTNEGGLAHDLLSPRRHIEKVYFVRVQGRLTESDCQVFASGMVLSDGTVCQSAGLQILSVQKILNEEMSEAQIILHEGKFHQIKRMLGQLGKPVVYLERIRMGNLELDRDLSRGEFRMLRGEEIQDLRALAQSGKACPSDFRASK